MPQSGTVHQLALFLFAPLPHQHVLSVRLVEQLVCAQTDPDPHGIPPCPYIADFIGRHVPKHPNSQIDRRLYPALTFAARVHCPDPSFAKAPTPSAVRAHTSRHILASDRLRSGPLLHLDPRHQEVGRISFYPVYPVGAVTLDTATDITHIWLEPLTHSTRYKCSSDPTCRSHSRRYRIMSWLVNVSTRRTSWSNVHSSWHLLSDITDWTCSQPYSQHSTPESPFTSEITCFTNAAINLSKVNK